MAHPQIRLVQAAAVPLSSSHLSPHQSHSSLPLATADSWGSQPPSCSPVSLCSSDSSKYFYAFLPPFKVGFPCFLIADIPGIILPSGTHSEEMARKLSLPSLSLPFTSPEHGSSSRLHLPSLLHYFSLPHPILKCSRATSCKQQHTLFLTAKAGHALSSISTTYSSATPTFY